MEKHLLLVVLASVLAVTCGAGTLEDGFRHPPREARPHTWWHWMNGNVSKEGITADLEAMHEAGIAGAHVFDAGCEIPPGPVLFNTPVWTDHLRHAAAEARRLGIELILSNASGWSCSGGPWIAPSNSMKVVAYSVTDVKGGATFDGELPLPAKTYGFYDDIAVLAVPKTGDEVPLMKSGEEREIGIDSPEPFVFHLARPVTATALALAVRVGGWCGQNKADVLVETSADGTAWTKCCDLEVPVAIDSILISDVQRRPLERETTSAHWRFTVSPRIPKGLRFYVSRVALVNRAVIPNYEGRTYRLRDEKPYRAFPAVGPALAKDAARDVSAALDRATGRFRWTAPAGGDWQILRIGYASNGKMNHPASQYGHGLEVDKLSRSALDFHFDQYVGRVCREFGELAGHGPGIAGVLVDSYEVGSGNWTQGLEKEFARRKGYRLEPFLPVLAGFVVGDEKETDAFLADYREVVAALFQENFAGAFQENCHKYGLKFYLEPYGNCPPNAFDYGRFCDVPMGEFWVSERSENHVGLQRWVSGTGHYWGRPVIGSEAFTAADGVCGWGIPYGKWATVPWDLKIQGDLAFTEGVNKMIFHRFTHQPWAKEKTYYPGMTMGRWGTHFDRTNTWWPYARGWMDYLARCQYLLQQGRPFADALVYLGDGLPMGISPYWDRLVPAGYDCDMVGTDGLAAADVRDGRVVSPAGNAYATLIIPEKPLVRPAAIAALKNLVDAGVKPVTRRAFEAKLPAPDFTCAGTTSLVSYVHRVYEDGTHGYFVAYADRFKPADLTLSFRVTGLKAEFWDPMTGRRYAAEARQKGGRTEVDWHAEVGDSVFVMLRPAAAELPRKPVLTAGTELAAEGTWKLVLPNGKTKDLAGPTDWSTIDDDDFRYFSGTATYVFTGRVKTGTDPVALDLGTVRDLAEVTVNGRTYPVLWKPPFVLDVTDALAVSGGVADVKLEVKVVNTWVNRLIGDERLFAEDCKWKGELGGIVEIPDWVKRGERSPTGRSTFTTWKFWKKGDRPLPSGLLGPVRFCGCVPFSAQK